MVLIKKSRYLPHFLNIEKKNAKGSFLVSCKKRYCDLGYYKKKEWLSYCRIPPQGPTPGSSPTVPP